MIKESIIQFLYKDENNLSNEELKHWLEDNLWDMIGRELNFDSFEITDLERLDDDIYRRLDNKYQDLSDVLASDYLSKVSLEKQKVPSYEKPNKIALGNFYKKAGQSLLHELHPDCQFFNLEDLNYIMPPIAHNELDQYVVFTVDFKY